MADDIASLGIAVDSRQAVKAGDDLDRLSGAASRAEQATDRLGRGSKRAGDQVEAASNRSGAATERMRQGFERTERQMSNFEGTIRRWGAALATALSVREVARYADTWSDLTARVRNAIGPLESTTATMERLSNMARRTYSSLEQTAETWLRNSTALNELGYSTKQQLDLTEALNNALVVSGARGQRAQTVMEAWSRAMAGGALRGQELNTILQSGDRVAKALADSMGVTTAELRKLGADGKITTQVMFGLTSQLEKLRAEADAMPATLGDAFTLMGNALLRTIGVYDQANNVSETFAGWLIVIADNMGLVAKAAVVLAAALAAAFAAQVAASIWAVVAPMVALEVALGAATIRAALFGAGLKALALSWNTLTAAMASNPIGLLAVVLATAATALWLFRDANIGAKDATEEHARAQDDLAGRISATESATRDAKQEMIDDTIVRWNAIYSLREQIAAEIDLARTKLEAARVTASTDRDPSSRSAARFTEGVLTDAIAELDKLVEQNNASMVRAQENIDRLIELRNEEVASLKSLTDEQKKNLKSAQDQLLSIQANTASLIAQADAYRDGEKAVIEARIAGEVRSAKLKNQMVDEAKLTKALRDQEAAQQRLAAAQQLVNDQEATSLAQARARAAMIADPAARHAAELAIERQAYLNKLTREYALELERIPELMNEFDRRRAYEEQVRYWNDVRSLAERISGDISDFLVDGFVNAGEGGKSMFRNLWDGAMAGAKRFLANLAAEFLKQRLILPIVTAFVGGNSGLMGIMAPGGGAAGALQSMSGGGFSFDGLSNLFSMQSTLGTSFVNSSVGQWLGLSSAPASGIGPINMSSLGQSVAGIGNFLGAGGVGYGVGSLFSSFGIGNAMGSQIGGALGGAIGSIIPGVGTIIGSVAGSLIGGMFGNDKPSNNFAMRMISTGDWSVGDPIFDPKERSQGTIDATTQMADAFVQASQAILALTGGTGPAGAFVVAGERDGFQVGVGREGIHLFNAGSYGKMGSFSDPQKALEWMIAEFARQITGDIDENFRIAIKNSKTSEELISNLDFVAQMLNLTAEAADPLVTALKAVNDNFDEATQRAQKLGLSTDLLAKIEAQRLTQIAEVEASFRLGAYASVYQSLDQINAWMVGQQMSAASSLNPLGRQALAEQQFREALAAVQGGDLSQTGALTSNATALINIARQNYGSTAGFTSIEQFVQSSLADLGMSIGSQQNIGDQVTKAIQMATQTNVQKQDEIIAAIEKLNQNIRLLADKAEAA